MVMTPEDKEQLKKFLRAIKELLEDIVKHPRPAIPGRHHAILAASWGELSPAQNGEKDIFQKGEDEINKSENDQKFVDHGLTGKQLTFKLALFWQAHDELLDIGRTKDGIGKALPWWKRWLPGCRRALIMGDVVLDSMAQVAVPFGPIKEFKKGIEACVQRSEEEYHDLPDTTIV